MDIGDAFGSAQEILVSKTSSILPFYLLGMGATFILRAIPIVGFIIAYMLLDSQGRIEKFRESFEDISLPQQGEFTGDEVNELVETFQIIFTGEVIIILALSFFLSFIFYLLVISLATSFKINTIHSHLEDPDGDTLFEGVKGGLSTFRTVFGLALTEAGVILVITLLLGFLLINLGGGSQEQAAAAVGFVFLWILLVLLTHAFFLFAPQSAVIDETGVIGALKNNVGFITSNLAEFIVYLVIAGALFFGVGIVGQIFSFLSVPNATNILRLLVVVPVLDIIKTSLFHGWREEQKMMARRGPAQHPGQAYQNPQQPRGQQYGQQPNQYAQQNQYGQPQGQQPNQYGQPQGQGQQPPGPGQQGTQGQGQPNQPYSQQGYHGQGQPGARGQRNTVNQTGDMQELGPDPVSGITSETDDSIVKRFIDAMKGGFMEMKDFLSRPTTFMYFVASLLIFFVTFYVGYSLNLEFLTRGISQAQEQQFEGITQSQNPLSAFSIFGLIFFNNWNIGVSLSYSGVVFGIPSIVILAQNGFVIGLVLGSTQLDPGTIFALTAPHGIIEIPALALSGAVGLHIGAISIKYARGKIGAEEIAEETTRTYKVVIGYSILFLVAAFIEAFVTFLLIKPFFG